MDRARLIGFLYLLSACAPHPESVCRVEIATSPLAVVDGATLSANLTAEFPPNEVGLAQELADALAVAADVWSVTPDVMSGWTIAAEGGWFACHTAGGAEWTWGCTYPDCRLMRIGPDIHGCRTGVLIHEVGHVVGVNDHADPRYAVAAEAAAAFCATRSTR